MFVAQAALVRTGLTRLHRFLGEFAMLIAISMLPVGIVNALRAACRGLAQAGIDPLTFMIVSFGTPASARFEFVGQQSATARGLTGLMVLVIAATDFRLLGRYPPSQVMLRRGSRRRVHGKSPATRKGASCLIAGPF